QRPPGNRPDRRFSRGLSEGICSARGRHRSAGFWPRITDRIRPYFAGIDSLLRGDSHRHDIRRSIAAVRCHRNSAGRLMHELGITQEIVALAIEHSGGAKVTRVVVEIGKLSLILPDAVRFCFDVCSEGTAVDGAKLEIVEIPGLAR